MQLVFFWFYVPYVYGDGQAYIQLTLKCTLERQFILYYCVIHYDYKVNAHVAMLKHYIRKLLEYLWTTVIPVFGNFSSHRS